MPKTKRPAAKAGKKCWSESFGVYGAKIRIAERQPGGVLYLLWLDNQGKQQKRSLGMQDRKGIGAASRRVFTLQQKDTHLRRPASSQVPVSQESS